MFYKNFWKEMKLNSIVFVLIFLSVSLQQGKSQIFPGLVGESLVEALRDAYTPGILLNDTQVKDTLYAKIYMEGDSVRCIYSGLARYLPSGVDPSQWLYGTGLEVGSINLEHSWPQAKGAGEGTNGNRDMHHLFPARSGINSDRGDFPFSDINDNQTQRWYYLSNEMATKPNTNINAYSEFVSGTFEPRESVKGDIARALFYFWTIYRADAMQADPNFFQSQLAYLCQWHDEDPVDDIEAMRNERIAGYQDGKLNPFIVDCSLVKRAYCSELAECTILSTEDQQDEINVILFNQSLQRFVISGEVNRLWHVQVFDVLGRVHYEGEQYEGVLGNPLTVPTGFYFIVASMGRTILCQKLYIP
jgi:endonuclease I